MRTYITHGFARTRIYRIYKGMKYRCYNKNNCNYSKYGARGITVCDEWLNAPQAFVEWSLVNGYCDDLTIDRIDNNKGYSPDNCRWATHTEQLRNTRQNHLLTINGETKTISEWSLSYGIPTSTINFRIKNGWSNIDAVCLPSETKFRHNKKIFVINGENLTVREMAEKYGLSQQTIRTRIRKNWPDDMLIITPNVKGCNYDFNQRSIREVRK